MKIPIKKSGVSFKNITDKIPVKKYENDVFVLENGLLFNFFQVQGKSYYNATDDELDNQVLKLAKYFRKDEQDLKIIFLNYPTDTSAQQKFLKDRLSKTSNKYYRKWLNTEIHILELLEKNRMDFEAYIFIYAKNMEDYYKRLDLLKYESSLNILEINLNKKINILRKLNNMNKDIKI